MLRPLTALLKVWISRPPLTLLGNPVGVAKLKVLTAIGAQFSEKVSGHVLTPIFIAAFYN